MRYRIIDNPPYTNRSKIGIELNPDNEPLKFLLSGLNTSEFPYYISELLENKNFGVEMASFIFYEQMDWEDKAEFLNEFGREIKEDEIRIRFYDGKVNYSALNKDDFEQIFYDYACKVLEVYGDDKQTQEGYDKYWQWKTDPKTTYGRPNEKDVEWYKENPNWKQVMRKYLKLLKEKLDKNK